jgi:DNA-binding MarR family transcriptional regulator
MSNSMSDREAREVAERLILASVRLIRRLRASDQEAKLSGPEASALAVVVYSGGVTLGELAAAEHVGPSAITKVAKQLEKAGLVVRAVDGDDRRVQRLRATSAGKTLLSRGQARHVRPLAKVLRSLPVESERALQAAIPVLERLCALVQSE